MEAEYRLFNFINSTIIV
uniref:Uncharacterized protein n=1 Tax=Romanomermis culicivorax TaxID=13658 RepID=A0A915HSI9_ROMCU